MKSRGGTGSRTFSKRKKRCPEGGSCKYKHQHQHIWEYYHDDEERGNQSNAKKPKKFEGVGNKLVDVDSGPGKKCSFCKQTGHTITKCTKEGVEAERRRREARKKPKPSSNNSKKRNDDNDDDGDDAYQPPVSLPSKMNSNNIPHRSEEDQLRWALEESKKHAGLSFDPPTMGAGSYHSEKSSQKSEEEGLKRALEESRSTVVSQNQLERQTQDLEYEESLLQDREEKLRKEREELETKEEEELAKALEASKELSKVEELREKEELRLLLEQCEPDDPSYAIQFRFPDNTVKKRNFNASDSFEKEVFEFLKVQEVLIDHPFVAVEAFAALEPLIKVDECGRLLESRKGTLEETGFKKRSVFLSIDD